MNVFIGSGKVTKINLLNGRMEMLKFTLAIREDNAKQERERIDLVPCIIYKPTEKVQSLLHEGKNVELQGKVRTFSFDIAGETTAKTEIVVNQSSLKNSD